MNRHRIFAVVMVAAVIATLLFFTQRGGKRSSGGGASGSSAGTYTGGHPPSSTCVGSCDLTTRPGVLKAYKDQTGIDVPLGQDCEYINRAFPRVVPFGGLGSDGACHRAGTLYGCCFTTDPRAATADALSLLGWADATFARRVELAENWVRFGIYGLADTFVVLDRQDFVDARLVLGRELNEAKALPLPEGGLDLTMWVVVHHKPAGDNEAIVDEYSRWNYVFAPDGALTGEKVIDHVMGKAH